MCTKTLETKSIVQVDEEFISPSSTCPTHKEIQVDDVVIVQEDINDLKSLLKDICKSSTKSNLRIISLNGLQKYMYASCGVVIEDYGFSIIINPRSSLIERGDEWCTERNQNLINSYLCSYFEIKLISISYNIWLC